VPPSTENCAPSGNFSETVAAACAEATAKPAANNANNIGFFIKFVWLTAPVENWFWFWVGFEFQISLSTVSIPQAKTLSKNKVKKQQIATNKMYVVFLSW
jgi:hypothetical protein